jgi:hypothetical protein
LVSTLSVGNNKPEMIDLLLPVHFHFPVAFGAIKVSFGTADPVDIDTLGRRRASYIISQWLQAQDMISLYLGWDATWSLKLEGFLSSNLITTSSTPSLSNFLQGW